MSFSNPIPENPVKKYIEYKGNDGVFQYWDKLQEKNIEIPTDKIKFIVLDELSCINGFSKPNKCGIYSNEVKNLKKEKLEVKSFKGNVHIVGLYSDIKGDAVSAGGKFTKSVYAGLLSDDYNDIELVNFKMLGSSFEGWIDANVNFQKQYVVIEKFEDKTNGATKYKMPVFAGVDIPENLVSKAIEMDKRLQEYFHSRESKEMETKETPVNEAQDVVDAIANKDVTVNDIIANPFEQMKNAKTLEEVKTIWTDNLALRTDPTFLKLKDEIKAKLSQGNELPIKQMQEATTIEELDKIYNSIKSNGVWGTCGQEFKDSIEQTYRKETDRLLPF